MNGEGGKGVKEIPRRVPGRKKTRAPRTRSDDDMGSASAVLVAQPPTNSSSAHAERLDLLESRIDSLRCVLGEQPTNGTTINAETTGGLHYRIYRLQRVLDFIVLNGGTIPHPPQGD